MLEVRDLKTYFYPEGTQGRTVKAVDGVSFSVAPKETLGIVGESGAGKTVTALSILRLIPQPPGKITGGWVKLNGENVLEMNKKVLRQVRGQKIAMIWQNPVASLNPAFTVGNQIKEVVLLKKSAQKESRSRKEVKDRVVNLLEMTGIPDPTERVASYPHELSAGLCQRVAIAMALASEPEFLIADEPTTALDVTVQAQILELLIKLKAEKNMGMVIIGHDLGVVAGACDHILVMYAGKVVEYGTAEDIFYQSEHPYTEGLLKCVPRVDGTETKLQAIKGSPASPDNLPRGCNFASRCEYNKAICLKEEPSLKKVGHKHYAACHLIESKES